MPVTSQKSDTVMIDGPLSAAQREQLVGANERARRILGAGRVATFNGWGLAVAGAATLLVGGFSVTTIVIGVALLLLAWNERRGRDLLRRLEPRGPAVLGKNQLALMALVTAYCLWTMYGTWAHPSSELEQLQALLGAAGSQTIELATGFVIRIYGAVILSSVLIQGLNARYYFARTGWIQEHLHETPAWIVDLQRAEPARP